MTTPNEITPEEELGRGVFSNSERRRAERLCKVRPKVFLYKQGVREISVVRLDNVSTEDLAEVGDKLAAERRGPFYGWGVVDSKDAAKNGRQVGATPQADNPYHADIVLPAQAAEDYEVQKRHAQQLADVSRWRDRSDPP